MKRDKKEQMRLRREVERLRKQLTRYEEEKYANRHDEEASPEEVVEEPKKGKGPKCPKCKQEMEVLDLGKYVYHVCTKDQTRCWHRYRANK